MHLLISPCGRILGTRFSCIATIALIHILPQHIFRIPWEKHPLIVIYRCDSKHYRRRFRFCGTVWLPRICEPLLQVCTSTVNPCYRCAHLLLSHQFLFFARRYSCRYPSEFTAAPTDEGSETHISTFRIHAHTHNRQKAHGTAHSKSERPESVSPSCNPRNQYPSRSTRVLHHAREPVTGLKKHCGHCTCSAAEAVL